MQAAEFHKLTVSSVEAITEESVRVTFKVPDGLEAAFTHVPGQHVIVRATIGGEMVRRSYSICSRAGSGSLQVGIKRLPGGVFSSFANTELKKGDVIEVTRPTGEFTVAIDPGITPVLSMIESVLADEPESRFTLVFGNKDGRSVMFLDDLGRLKNHNPGRFALFNILSRESNAMPMFEGRLDEDKLVQLFTTVVDAASATDWYLSKPLDPCWPAAASHPRRSTTSSSTQEAMHRLASLSTTRSDRPSRSRSVGGRQTLSSTQTVLRSSITFSPFVLRLRSLVEAERAPRAVPR